MKSTYRIAAVIGLSFLVSGCPSVAGKNEMDSVSVIDLEKTSVPVNEFSSLFNKAIEVIHNIEI